MVVGSVEVPAGHLEYDMRGPSWTTFDSSPFSWITTTTSALPCPGARKHRTACLYCTALIERAGCTDDKNVF
jgi:hypothetical protein